MTAPPLVSQRVGGPAQADIAPARIVLRESRNRKLDPVVEEAASDTWNGPVLLGVQDGAQMKRQKHSRGSEGEL